MSATNGKSEKSLSLPSAPAIQAAPSITIQPPLSRAGKGPGLIILIDQESATEASTESIDPPPLQKWAEESFVVAQIDLSQLQKSFEVTLSDALLFVKDLDTFDGNEKFGLICEYWKEEELDDSTDKSQHTCLHRTPTLST
jgi:carboxymethylenebutenolidase